MGLIGIAPGLLQHGVPLNHQARKVYSAKSLRPLEWLSATLYAVTVGVFFGTLVVYNPNNAFGYLNLPSIPPPSVTTIEAFYSEGCTGLSLLDVAGTFNSAFSPQSIEFLLTFRNLSETSPFTLELEDGTFVNSEVFINGSTFNSFSAAGNASLTFHVEIDVVPPDAVSLSGNVDECEEYFYPSVVAFAENCNTPTSEIPGCEYDPPNEAAAPKVEVVLLDGDTDIIGVSFQNLLDQYDYEIFNFDETNLRREIREHFCEDGSATDVANNLDKFIGPFACTRVTYRSLLEVVALSFSNASFLYTFIVVFLLQCATVTTKVEDLKPPSLEASIPDLEKEETGIVKADEAKEKEAEAEL